MATPEEIQAAYDKADDIVIIDGVRYTKADAERYKGAKKASADAEKVVTSDTAKGRTPAANKARTAGDGDK